MPYIVFPCIHVAILILHTNSPLLILYYQETSFDLENLFDLKRKQAECLVWVN